MSPHVSTPETSQRDTAIHVLLGKVRLHGAEGGSRSDAYCEHQIRRRSIRGLRQLVWCGASLSGRVLLCYLLRKQRDSTVKVGWRACCAEGKDKRESDSRGRKNSLSIVQTHCEGVRPVTQTSLPDPGVLCCCRATVAPFRDRPLTPLPIVVWPTSILVQTSSVKRLETKPYVLCSRMSSFRTYWGPREAHAPNCVTGHSQREPTTSS